MDFSAPLAVVTPSLDGDILTHLALTQASYTPGHLARLLRRGSVEGIRKALNRLATQGVVDTRTFGRAVAYTLNTEHLAYEPIRQLAKARWRLRDLLRAEVASWPVAPCHAALFGSVAWGETTLASDIDLFVAWPDDSPEEGADCEASLTRRAFRATGNDARIVSMTASEALRQAGAADPLMSKIARKGVAIGGGDVRFAEWGTR